MRLFNANTMTAFCFVAALAPSARGEGAAETDPLQQRRIAALIAQLDSDSFNTREAATAALIDMGPPAAPALLKAVLNASAEASHRAFGAIVRQALAAEQADRRGKAFEALEQLAHGAENRFTQRAREELTRVQAFALAAEAEVEEALRAMHGLVIRNAQSRIETVNLSLAEADPAVFKTLAKLRYLTTLDLSGAKVDDDEAAALADLTRLVHLKLIHNPLGDAGVATLTALPKLHTLDLSATRITDRSLAHLAKMKALRSVRLFGTVVTENAVAALREKRPDLKVEH